MPKTYYLSNNVVNTALRGVSFTPPGTVYVGLYTTAPNLLGEGVEVSGGSYARQAVSWTNPSNGQTSNSADVNFPIATAVWGTVTAFAILDAPSGGNVLYYANLNAPRLVSTDDQVRFPTGQLMVVED